MIVGEDITPRYGIFSNAMKHANAHSDQQLHSVFSGQGK